MAETLLIDTIIPEIFLDYFSENSVLDTTFFTSGIVRPLQTFNTLLDGGAQEFSSPFWHSLTKEGDTDEVPKQDADVTIGKITAGSFVVRRQFRVHAWGSNDLTTVAIGEDPMTAIANQINQWWSTRMQANLFSSLQGVIADNIANDGGDLVLDITANTGDQAKINEEAIIDATFLMGSKFSKITAMSMHSIPYSRMIKLGLVDSVPLQDQDSRISYYQDKRVIVSDEDTFTLETVNEVADTPVYWITFFKEGAFGYGETMVGYQPLSTERDEKRGGGKNYLHSRKVFALHPEGFTWTNDNTIVDEYPTNAELQDSSHWNRVFEKKNVNFVVLKTLG